MIKIITLLIITIELLSQEPTGIRKSDYWLIRSYTYKIKSDYEEMFKCYETALKLKPDNDVAYFKSGYDNIYCNKNYNKAIDNIKKAISINKKEFYYWYYLIEAYILKKDYNNAIRHSKKALKYFKDNEIILEKLLHCYVTVNNIYGTENTVKKLLAKDPTNIDLKKILYEIYVNKNKHRKSIEIAKEILKIKPNDFEILYNLSVYYLTKNKKKELISLKEYINNTEQNYDLITWINVLINIYYEKDYDVAYKNILFLLSNIDNIDILIGFHIPLLQIIKQNFKYFGTSKTDTIFQKIFMSYNKILKNSESYNTEIFETVLNDYYSFLTTYFEPDLVGVKYNLTGSLLYNKSNSKYWYHKIFYFISLLDYNCSASTIKCLRENKNMAILDSLINTCDTAISIYPYIFDFYLIKAKYQIISNKYDSAERTLDMLIRANEILYDSINLNSLYLNLRSNIYFYRENYDLSQEYMCRFLENRKANCRELIYYLYIRIKNNDVGNDLENLLQNCLKTDTTNYFIYAVQALLKVKQKKYKEALDYYHKFLSHSTELIPDLARIYNDIGDLFLEINDINQAIEFWTLAIENNYNVINVLNKINSLKKQ